MQNFYQVPCLWIEVTSFPVKILTCHISRARHASICTPLRSSKIHSIEQKLHDFMHRNFAYLALICAVWSGRDRAGKNVTTVTSVVPSWNRKVANEVYLSCSCIVTLVSYGFNEFLLLYNYLHHQLLGITHMFRTAASYDGTEAVK